MNLILFIKIFLSLSFFYFLGYWVKNYLQNKHPDKKIKIGTVEGSLLALFAFFLSYTISLASSKFENRRNIIIQESNKIGTAYLRTQLFSQVEKEKFRKLFEEYTTYRIDYFNSIGDAEKEKKASDLTDQKDTEIWNYAAELFKGGKFVEASRQLIPALNDMIDQVSVRSAIFDTRIAKPILWTLIILSLSSSFIVGYSSHGNYNSDIIGFLYVLIISLLIYLIFDSDSANSGVINADRANKTFTDLLQQIKSD